MTTADYALIVSILSFVVSFISLGWNIWSKFIYPKAKLNISFGVMRVIGDDTDFRVISLAAVNYGPTDLTLHSAVCRYRLEWSWAKFRRPWQIALLNTLHNFPVETEFTLGPFSGGLPKKLAIGERFTSHVPFEHQYLKDVKIIDVGFNDTFDRIHWAPRASVRDVRKQVIEHFSKTP